MSDNVVACLRGEQKKTLRESFSALSTQRALVTGSVLGRCEQFFVYSVSAGGATSIAISDMAYATGLPNTSVNTLLTSWFLFATAEQ